MSVLRIDREAEEEKSTWKVHVETKNAEGKEEQDKVLECDKLILAIGTASTPSLPEDLDWSKFNGHVMHSKEVGIKHHLLTADTT